MSARRLPPLGLARKKARDGSAVANQRARLARTVKLHEDVCAMSNLRRRQAYSGAHCAVVAVVEACVLACTRLDEHGMSGRGQTLRTLGCQCNPSLIG